MKYEPYEISIMALQEIGRNDLIYFIDNPYSHRPSIAGVRVPHFDTNFVGQKNTSDFKNGELRVPYRPRKFSCSNYDDMPHTGKYHSDRITIAHWHLTATIQDLAFVERAMFLGFKYAGVQYGCAGCDNEFQTLGVHLTNESDVM